MWKRAPRKRDVPLNMFLYLYISYPQAVRPACRQPLARRGHWHWRRDPWGCEARKKVQQYSLMQLRLADTRCRRVFLWPPAASSGGAASRACKQVAGDYGIDRCDGVADPCWYFMRGVGRALWRSGSCRRLSPGVFRAAPVSPPSAPAGYVLVVGVWVAAGACERIPRVLCLLLGCVGWRQGSRPCSAAWYGCRGPLVLPPPPCVWLCVFVCVLCGFA